MQIHFEWTETMSVGEPIIDAQHQKLLAQLNKVIDAMVSDVGSKEVVDALAFFEQYMNEHFSYEEKYMLEHSYAELEEHKKKHQSFKDKYSDFKNKLDAGTTPGQVLIGIEEFLGEWWLEHIGHEDRKYYLAFSGKA